MPVQQGSPAVDEANADRAVLTQLNAAATTVTDNTSTLRQLVHTQQGTIKKLRLNQVSYWRSLISTIPTMLTALRPRRYSITPPLQLLPRISKRCQPTMRPLLLLPVVSTEPPAVERNRFEKSLSPLSRHIQVVCWHRFICRLVTSAVGKIAS